MTDRHTGPDRYASTPGHYAAVGGAILATIAVVIGTAAGPRAGLTAAALLIGLPCAGTGVLVLLCLAADASATAVHRRALRRAHLDRVDVADIAGQAHTDLAHRLDQEARPTALRTRFARLLDSLTHSGPGYDPQADAAHDEHVRATAYRWAADLLRVWAEEGLLNAPEYGSHENVLDAADRLRGLADDMDQRRRGQEDMAPVIDDAEAERLSQLADCPTSRHNGLHCLHYQEGDGPCCDCNRANWCPAGGVL